MNKKKWKIIENQINKGHRNKKPWIRILEEPIRLVENCTSQADSHCN